MKKLPLVMMLVAGTGWCEDFSVWQTTQTVYDTPTMESFEHLRQDVRDLEARVKKLEDAQPKSGYQGEIINNPVNCQHGGCVEPASGDFK